MSSPPLPAFFLFSWYRTVCMHYPILKLIFHWVISTSFTSNITQSSPGPLVVMSKRFPSITCTIPLTYWIWRGCSSSLSGYNGLWYQEETHLSKPHSLWTQKITVIRQKQPKLRQRTEGGGWFWLSSTETGNADHFEMTTRCSRELWEMFEVKLVDITQWKMSLRMR